MSTLDRIRQLYRHMEWADAEIWRCVIQSPECQQDDQTRSRLHHLHMVQRAFSNFWRGNAHVSGAGRDLSLGQLLPWAKDYYDTLRSYLQNLAPQSLMVEMNMPWSASVSESIGRPAGQVAMRLKEMNVIPPLSDYIVRLWYGSPSHVWPDAGAR